jgi:hypothetical protein
MLRWSDGVDSAEKVARVRVLFNAFLGSRLFRNLVLQVLLGEASQRNRPSQVSRNVAEVAKLSLQRNVSSRQCMRERSELASIERGPLLQRGCKFAHVISEKDSAKLDLTSRLPSCHPKIPQGCNLLAFGAVASTFQTPATPKGELLASEQPFLALLEPFVSRTRHQKRRKWVLLSRMCLGSVTAFSTVFLRDMGETSRRNLARGDR